MNTWYPTRILFVYLEVYNIRTTYIIDTQGKEGKAGAVCFVLMSINYYIRAVYTHNSIVLPVIPVFV